MKTLYSLLLFCLTISLSAQNDQDKVVGEFKEIKVYDRIEVQLIKSDENRVVVSGKNTEDLVIVHKKDILKIRMTLEEAFDGDETTVKVYYTTLEIIDSNEGAVVESNDVIEQFELKVKAQEGGKVRLNVKDLKFFEVKAVSGGSIEASGNSKNQTVDINTGGSYEGEDLITENTKVTIKAAGVAHVNATKDVEAKVRAGGSVYVYGNPENVDKNTVLGGKIIIKE
ncbi:head GIN domain-containing protein [Lacinutrix iliipiscaria]|uniref:Head GIN domain-containing protein n=1 Tax=Lacinutrix iliipiscaria TaxID=1230532 RepID=A0ABW5WKY7_9FLAO